MIPMLCVYSENYVDLFNKFRDSVPLGFELKPKKIELLPPFGFQTDSWYSAIEQKIRYVLDSIKTVPENALFCISDTDIYFFGKTNELYTYVQRCFQRDTKLQLLVMEEDDIQKPNGGFMVLKNSPKIRRLIENMLEGTAKKLPLADQSILYRDIPYVKHQYIDRDLVAWGTKMKNPQKVLFHHAVCCRTVEEKLSQQELIKSKINKNE